MSEYIVVQSNYNDAECIKLALKDLGYVFEEHEVEQKLVGYAGDRRQQTAHIIIRRQNVGMASNDVGFKKRADGNYELIISEYDKRSPKTAKNLLEQMKVLYNKHKVVRQLKRIVGTTVTSIKPEADGRIKIKALVR